MARLISYFFNISNITKNGLEYGDGIVRIFPLTLTIGWYAAITF